MKNLFLRFPVTPSESVEVYIGQNSGKQLQAEIGKAEKEVLVISPYIDKAKLDELIHLEKRGVTVRLAFSDLRREQEKEILQKLITQVRFTDTRKQQQVKFKTATLSVLSFAALAMGIYILALSASRLLEHQKVNYIFMLSLPLLYLFYYLYFRKRKEAAAASIYSYEYNPTLPFRYLRNTTWNNEPVFFHSKIYIIDRKIAYLGSVNFTNNGFSSNLETRIRINHREKIAELVDFVQAVFTDPNAFRAHDISYLGRRAWYEDQPGQFRSNRQA